MEFKELSQYFEKIEHTSSRLEITEHLAVLFKNLSESEIDKTTYLLQGRLTPLYKRLDFGVAEKMVIKSAINALQIDRTAFLHQNQTIGDIGKTIEYFKKTHENLLQYEKGLSVLEVYNMLLAIAQANGTGSQEIKLQRIAELIQRLDPLSTRYISRIVTGVMRLGFSDMTVLDAFSWMLQGNKDLRSAIEKVYHVRPDLGFIGKILKLDGISGLSHIKPEIFIPIIMMRAERASSGLEIIEKVGISSVEPKYDGFRLQVHFQKKDKVVVRLYSRNLDEVTYMYPDIVEGVIKELKVKEAIIEGEAIGFNPQTGDFLPFQQTVQRKRKYGISEKVSEIPLKLFAFELLYVDGKNFIAEPFIERRRMLEKIIHRSGDIFTDTLLISPEKIVDTAKQLELQFDEAVSKGLEGIMSKKLDGVYQAGARGWNWIKFKRSYSSKIDDTIDCVVMGYDFGRGKRAGFGIGAFLVGIYDEKNDQFVTVAKIGTGLTDTEWRELKERADHYISDKKPALYEVDKMMEVDKWVKPEIVVEIKADEITKSPVHTAGRKMKQSKSGSAVEVDVPGYALRFPRLIRFREDRRPEESTTLDEVDEMFRKATK